MATAPEGMFGSIVRNRPRLPKVPKAPASSFKIKPNPVSKAPSIHVTALHVDKSLYAPPTHSANVPGVSSSMPGPVQKASASNAHGSALGILGEAGGGVVSFLGHLGADVVHTAYGIPMGLTYMAEHPIAGLEKSGQAMWADWSPLFHGNVGQWAHNFYMHPLGPILDVAGLATGGAAIVGRTAGGLGALGDAARSAEAAATASEEASGAARAAAGAVPRTVAVRTGPMSFTVKADAGVAGIQAGRAGIGAVNASQRLMQFANPAAYAAKAYRTVAESLGHKGADAEKFVQEALAQDRSAYNVHIDTRTGLTKYEAVQRNPLLRARSAQVQKLAKTPVGKMFKIDKIAGDQAVMRRFVHYDKGSRRAALRVIVQRQIKQMANAGEMLSHMTPLERIRWLHDPMRAGLLGQAHYLEKPAGATDAQWLKSLRDQNYQLVKKTPDLSTIEKHIAQHGEAGYEKVLTEHWGAANTTSVIDKSQTLDDVAFKDPQGRYAVVSAPGEIGKEALNSSKVVQLLFTNPTRVWRYAMLGISPRYFVNNFLGNGIMLMAATDPVTMLGALAHHIMSHSAEGRHFDAGLETFRAEQLQAGRTPAEVEQAIREQQFHRNIFGQHWGSLYADEHGFAQSNLTNEGGSKRLNVIDTLNRKVSLHGVTHKLADMPFRHAAMTYTMKRIPEFQDAYAANKVAGMGHFEAENKAAISASASPAVRQLVRQQVHHMQGNYLTFTRFEKGVRSLVPFYAWDRAITKNFAHIITQAPYKAAMGAAIGRVGTKQRNDLLGQVPSFAESLVPLAQLRQIPGLGWIPNEGAPGRIGTLNTMSMNPYGTIGNLAEAAMGVTGTDQGSAGISAAAGNLNPLLTAGIGQLTGTDPATQGKVKPGPGGPIIGTFMGAFGSLPPINAFNALRGQGTGANVTKSGKATLYSHSPVEPGTSFLGVPIRQLNLGAAQYDYQRQLPKKKHAPKPSTSIPGN